MHRMFLLAVFRNTTAALAVRQSQAHQHSPLTTATRPKPPVQDIPGSWPSQWQKLVLHVGLENGVLVRLLVDNVTGALTDSRQQFLGTRAIKLTKITINGTDAMIALSNKPWLCYSYMGRYSTTPLAYETLTCVTPFSSERCPEGIVAIAGNTLRII